MSATITHLLDEALRESVFSGYQLISHQKGKSEVYVGGRTSFWDGARDVDHSTLFDLGSVTKVVATTTILARAVEQKKISLESSLADHGLFENSAYASITVEQLLSHCAGLVWWAPFFKTGGDVEAWFQNNAATAVVTQPGEKTTYSDPSFWMLGLVVEKVLGSLPKLFQSEVVEPLGLKNISWGPVKEENVAATEYDPKARVLAQGEVFDENCRAMGGTAAHAGLFGSAESLIPFCKMWLESVLSGTDWLSKETAQRFVTKSQQTGTFGLGWDTKSPQFSTAGDKLSSKSFGTLGFPGTSIWVDPEKEGWVIFLTNRVHPSRVDDRIKRYRPLVHNALAERWS